MPGEAPPIAGPDPPHTLSRGVTIGRYVILGELGAGGMGVVYAAYDPELDRKIAIKLVQPHADAAGTARTRLLREAQALAKLAHPNVVTVYDVGQHGDRVWIAMEFVAGSTLRAWAAERTRTWRQLLSVLIDVARGVAAAHVADLVHRDLKPDNVMISDDDRVRVMDFGLAYGRAFNPEPQASVSLNETGVRPEFAAFAAKLTQAGGILGTPPYMAPEQWEGKNVGGATDQFSWSVMAWEILYGERPFVGESPLGLAVEILSGRRRPPPKLLCPYLNP